MKGNSPCAWLKWLEELPCQSQLSVAGGVPGTWNGLGLEQCDPDPHDLAHYDSTQYDHLGYSMLHPLLQALDHVEGHCGGVRSCWMVMEGRHLVPQVGWVVGCGCVWAGCLAASLHHPPRPRHTHRLTGKPETVFRCISNQWCATDIRKKTEDLATWSLTLIIQMHQFIKVEECSDMDQPTAKYVVPVSYISSNLDGPNIFGIS